MPIGLVLAGAPPVVARTMGPTIPTIATSLLYIAVVGLKRCGWLLLVSVTVLHLIIVIIIIIIFVRVIVICIPRWQLLALVIPVRLLLVLLMLLIPVWLESSLSFHLLYLLTQLHHVLLHLVFLFYHNIQLWIDILFVATLCFFLTQGFTDGLGDHVCKLVPIEGINGEFIRVS